MSNPLAVAAKAPGNPLAGRTLYIPRMSTDGAAAVAAACRAVGIDGQLVPEADAGTLDLARQPPVFIDRPRD